MDELEQKKREIADLDNLRIERDSILIQTAEKNSELSELNTKTEQARSTLVLVENQREVARKGHDRIVSETADLVLNSRIEMNERAAAVSASEAKLAQDRKAFEDQKKKADARDASQADRERSITARETEIARRESDHANHERDVASSHALMNGLIDAREVAVVSREVAVSNKEEENAKKEALLKLQGDDTARDRASLEAEKASHSVFKAETTKEAEGNRARAVGLDKQAQDVAVGVLANVTEAKRLEGVAATLADRESQCALKELENRVAGKKLDDRERAVQLKEQLT